MQESNLPMEMGGLDPQYECPICLSCLKEPMLTSCGHRFCYACLNAWLESKGERCPVDGSALDRKSDLFPDHFTRREILSRRTVCRTCHAEMGISELEEHALSHTDASGAGDGSDGRCPFNSIGCKVRVTKDSLNDHLTTDVHLHLNLLANSHANLKEKVKCSDKMTEALAHEADLWEPQEKGKEQVNASLMRALYERVVVLEQRCHEQNAQIQKLKSQVEEADRKVREVSLLHACGQHLWRIEGFSQKVAAMKSGVKMLYFSEGFYTSATGYKFCGRINLSPNNGDQLSLLVHLMKTPHDCTLEWPFTGRIHLGVIHPTEPELSVRETMMTRPDLDSFKRPTKDMNTKAFGYPQFICISDVFKKGFLVEDVLLVKIHIQRV